MAAAPAAWRDHDEPAPDGGSHSSSCAAHLMWQSACGALEASAAEQTWTQIVDSSASDGIWHSLKNCVAYQAGVWENLLAKGIPDVMQPAAFKMAIILRHTPSDLVVKILSEMLKSQPQCRDLSSYVLALLTEECASGCSPSSPPSPRSPTGPAPSRDLQLH